MTLLESTWGAQPKRFTDAELAAEVWKASLGRALTTERVLSRLREPHRIIDTLKRFATTPSYDEVNA